MNDKKKWISIAGASGALALGVAACGGSSAGQDGSGLSGTISIDGSSTVAPLSEAAAELFQQENPGVRVTVGTSGTGGGFEKFCRGETDVSDASRPITPEEAQLCERNGVDYEELQVANDGLALVVHPENDFVECLTTEELNRIWKPGSKVSNWSDVRAGFPDQELELFGPGTDSGTFDYFTEAINGEEGASRSDYSASEDDNVILQGVSGTEGGTAYFGLSYVEQNPDKVKAVQIENEDGECVAPSTETVQSGAYNPLSRPLFVYPSAEALQRQEVRAFLDFYIDNQEQITQRALYVPLTEEQLTDSRDKIASLGGGAAGGAQPQGTATQ